MCTGAFSSLLCDFGHFSLFFSDLSLTLALSSFRFMSEISFPFRARANHEARHRNRKHTTTHALPFRPTTTFSHPLHLRLQVSRDRAVVSSRCPPVAASPLASKSLATHCEGEQCAPPGLPSPPSRLSCRYFPCVCMHEDSVQGAASVVLRINEFGLHEAANFTRQWLHMAMPTMSIPPIQVEKSF